MTILLNSRVTLDEIRGPGPYSSRLSHLTLIHTICTPVAVQYGVAQCREQLEMYCTQFDDLANNIEALRVQTRMYEAAIAEVDQLIEAAETRHEFSGISAILC